jgi:hypothetical protein
MGQEGQVGAQGASCTTGKLVAAGAAAWAEKASARLEASAVTARKRTASA